MEYNNGREKFVHSAIMYRDNIQQNFLRLLWWIKTLWTTEFIYFTLYDVCFVAYCSLAVYTMYMKYVNSLTLLRIMLLLKTQCVAIDPIDAEHHPPSLRERGRNSTWDLHAIYQTCFLVCVLQLNNEILLRRYIVHVQTLVIFPSILWFLF